MACSWFLVVLKNWCIYRVVFTNYITQLKHSRVWSGNVFTFCSAAAAAASLGSHRSALLLLLLTSCSQRHTCMFCLPTLLHALNLSPVDKYRLILRKESPDWEGGASMPSFFGPTISLCFFTNTGRSFRGAMSKKLQHEECGLVIQRVDLPIFPLQPINVDSILRAGAWESVHSNPWNCF